jgi:hypothetical protein
MPGKGKRKATGVTAADIKAIVRKEVRRGRSASKSGRKRSRSSSKWSRRSIFSRGSLRSLSSKRRMLRILLSLGFHPKEHTSTSAIKQVLKDMGALKESSTYEKAAASILEILGVVQEEDAVKQLLNELLGCSDVLTVL